MLLTNCIGINLETTFSYTVTYIESSVMLLEWNQVIKSMLQIAKTTKKLITKGITKHYKHGIFFKISLLMKYKKERVKHHVKNEYNKRHCRSFLSQLSHIYKRRPVSRG